MANTLTNVIPQLLAQGLLTLREFSIMPRLVNANWSSMAAEKGSSIDVPIPSAVNVKDVSPNYIPATTHDTSPTKVTIELDQWKEAPFYLTDKDILEAMNGIIPMQAGEAIKSLANTVDQALLSTYKSVYGRSGTPGTPPFAASIYEATQARKVLSNQLCPLSDRRFVMNADAEANALGLRAFQDSNFGITDADIREGNLPRKLGFTWAMDQNVRDHTCGSLGGTTADPTLTTGLVAASVATVNVDVGATNALSLVKGDIITFSGHDQTYVITTATSVSAGSTVDLPISPALTASVATGESITLDGENESVSSYGVNMAFHRDAIAFASRPLADSADGLGNLIQTAVDPISGISLRLEVSREHKRTRFSYDILYGYKLVRPQLACRVHG